MPPKETGYALVVGTSEVGKRLDKVVFSFLENQTSLVGLSRSRIARWIEEGSVFLGSKPITKVAYQLRLGEKIGIFVPSPKPSRLISDSSIKLDVIYEDAQILVINKPAGLVVHPGAGQQEGTLVHALLSRLGDDFTGVGDELRPGIVHRLDKNTSGVLVVAKTHHAHQALSEQFARRTVKKTYQALVYNLPGKGSAGTIESEIGRHRTKRTKMAVLKKGGKLATTHWKVLEELRYGYLLEVKIETGRTHQIRVHLSHAKAPIVGDKEYGGFDRVLPNNIKKAVKEFGRQALHAERITFLHPQSKKNVTFEAELAADMKKIIKIFDTREE